MHASIAAHSFGVRLLTQFVRYSTLGRAFRKRTSQVADGTTNALADAVVARQSTGMAVLVLVIQLVVRMSWLGTCAAILTTTATWRTGATDSLVFDFCGVLAVNSIGLVICMFLRVYRVIASHVKTMQHFALLN